MTLAPRDYIAERRREINQRIQVLRSELDTLDRMESSLGDGPLLTPQTAMQVVGHDNFSGLAPESQGEPAPKKRRVVEGGIKGLILEALAKAANDGLASRPLIHAIYQISNIMVPRTSLSPQLSRLKAENKVQLDGGIWKITTEGLKSVL